ncbi:MAG: PKD domain-containing protein, partial [Bacteroidales bacterium]
SGTAGSSGSPGGCQSLAYSSYYTSNTGNHIQYDGYTTALTASAIIRACRQYHMKLSLANVGDNGYDSGVFLKEGSFTSPEIEKINMFAIDNDTLIKNCNDLNIKLKLNRPNTRSNNIEVMTNGTAILNSDYTITWNNRPLNSGDNITFLEGDTILSLHVFPLPDATFNAGETKKIIIYLAIELCDYTPLHEGPVIKYDTLEYYLIDNDFVRLTSEEQNFCNVCQQVAINVESGTEPLLYSWFPTTGIANPNTQISEANITHTTTYSVIASDRWGCQKDTAQYRVVIQPRPKIEATHNPESGCVPLTVNFNSNSTPDGATHTWVINHTDTLTETNPSKTFTDPGLYSVYLHVSSAPNCNDSLYLENAIRVSDYPHANFYYTPEEPLNGRPVNFTNTSIGENITDYSWNFGDGSSSSIENPDHSYSVSSDELFNVLLTVSNIDGCENDTLIQLKVTDQYAFWVPNSFSPNHDGINDIFLPKVNDLLKYHLQIYDRFGNCIFNSVDPAIGWDGTYKKDNCQMGVYVWKITYITYTNTDMELIKLGSVVLVR